MGCEELNPLELVRVDATRMHKRERAINVAGHEFIPLTGK